MAIYGYCRCSTDDTKQNVDRQIKDVIELGAEAQLVYTEYESGTKRDRIELNRLLEAVTEGDTIIVTEVSRISRSMKDLLEILDICKDKKVKMILGAFILDFTKGDTDPMVMAMVQMMGVFSQMERDIIANRVKSGLENAKAKGKTLGRPITTLDKIPQLFLKYYPKYKSGELKVTELCRLSKINSRTTAYKYIKILERGGK